MRPALSAALVGALLALGPLAAHAQAASDSLVITLIPEPLATAPALYLGKPGVPREGSVRLVALVSARSALGKAVNPSALTYTWIVNGVTASASGVGKNVLIAAAPLEYRAETVSVSAASADGTLSGAVSLTLTAQEPSIRLYENDPLLGIRFERALTDTYALTGSEASLYGAPFSFPTDAGAPTLTWYLDSAPAQQGNLITLRPAGSGQGTATLSLMAAAGSFVKATTALGVSFGGVSTGFLGL